MSANRAQHDMTMMYAMHDALRRELAILTRIAARDREDPARVVRAALGWELFKTFLHLHHSAEDEALWPVMRQALAGHPGDLAVVEAMEAEHAAIDPLLASIDAALSEPDGSLRLGDLTGALDAALRRHLEHEEREALPLIDATLSAAQVQRYGEVHGARIGAHAPRFLPWMVEGAPADTTAKILAFLPEPVRQAYQVAWRPAYAALDLWGAR